MTDKSEILQAYDSAFGAAAADLPGSGLGWLSAARGDAMENFQRLGFPTRKSESWRYTDLRPLTDGAYHTAGSKAVLTRADLPGRSGMGGAQVVMVNGKFSKDLSNLAQLDPSVTLMSLEEALDQKPELVEEHLSGGQDCDGVRHLNTALMSAGCVIILEAGATPEFPLEILYLGDSENDAAAHMRNLIILDKGSSLNLIETYRGGSNFWNNIVTGVFVAESASLTHYQNQSSDAKALLSVTTSVEIAENGSYSNFVLTKGGRVTRNEIQTLLQGPGARASLDGLCLARAEQSLANVTVVEHQSADTASSQRYKSILDTRASAAFQGRVVVARDAQRSEAHQASDSLILGDGATANAKPELLIHADDVKCSHGATVGALDEAALFYLNSRGLDPAAAREILVAAFAEEILQGISSGIFREIIREEVGAWMQGSPEAGES